MVHRGRRTRSCRRGYWGRSTAINGYLASDRLSCPSRKSAARRFDARGGAHEAPAAAYLLWAVAAIWRPPREQQVRILLSETARSDASVPAMCPMGAWGRFFRASVSSRVQQIGPGSPISAPGIGMPCSWRPPGTLEAHRGCARGRQAGMASFACVSEAFAVRR